MPSTPIFKSIGAYLAGEYWRMLDAYAANATRDALLPALNNYRSAVPATQRFAGMPFDNPFDLKTVIRGRRWSVKIHRRNLINRIIVIFGEL